VQQKRNVMYCCIHKGTFQREFKPPDLWSSSKRYINSEMRTQIMSLNTSVNTDGKCGGGSMVQIQIREFRTAKLHAHISNSFSIWPHTMRSQTNYSRFPSQVGKNIQQIFVLATAFCCSSKLRLWENNRSPESKKSN